MMIPEWIRWVVGVGVGLPTAWFSWNVAHNRARLSQHHIESDELNKLKELITCTQGNDSKSCGHPVYVCALAQKIYGIEMSKEELKTLFATANPSKALTMRSRAKGILVYHPGNTDSTKDGHYGLDRRWFILVLENLFANILATFAIALFILGVPFFFFAISFDKTTDLISAIACMASGLIVLVEFSYISRPLYFAITFVKSIDTSALMESKFQVTDKPSVYIRDKKFLHPVNWLRRAPETTIRQEEIVPQSTSKPHQQKVD
jgi:hypothetical protein